MRQASQQLINLLNLNDEFNFADLFIIQTKSGQMLFFTNFDYDIELQGIIFDSKSLIIERSNLNQQNEIKIDTLTLDIKTNDDYLINGITYTKAFHDGFFDGALISVYRLFLDNLTSFNGSALLGNMNYLINLFMGYLSTPEISRNEITLQVLSVLDSLTTQMPRNLYQEGCKNTLFDSGCGLNKAVFSIARNVLVGSTKNTILYSSNQAQGYYNQGVIEITSGPNAGLKRTIKQDISGQLILSFPLPNNPQVGQSIIIYPGCNKTLETCSVKFNNKANFAGFPFIPIPETSI